MVPVGLLCHRFREIAHLAQGNTMPTMKQLRLPIFTSKIKYYNLRIVPPQAIFDEVCMLKKQFEFAYGKQPLSRSKPHIAIASFKMNAKHQNYLLEVLEQLAKRRAFKLQVDGFGIFEPSGTLYLKVLENEHLRAIREEVRLLHSTHLKKRLRQFVVSDHPHMTISKTTGRQMLHTSLKYFQEKGFSKDFEVHHLRLVSRAKHRPWDWEYEIKLLR